MSQTIEISDKAYDILSKHAKNAGVTLGVYIDESVVKGEFVKSKHENGGKKKTSEKDKLKAWEDFIGAMDSSKLDPSIDRLLPLDKRIKKVFGDVVEEKMRRVGLKTIK